MYEQPIPAEEHILNFNNLMIKNPTWDVYTQKNS